METQFSASTRFYYCSREGGIGTAIDITTCCNQISFRVPKVSIDWLCLRSLRWLIASVPALLAWHQKLLLVKYTLMLIRLISTTCIPSMTKQKQSPSQKLNVARTLSSWDDSSRSLLPHYSGDSLFILVTKRGWIVCCEYRMLMKRVNDMYWASVRTRNISVTRGWYTEASQHNEETSIVYRCPYIFYIYIPCRIGIFVECFSILYSLVFLASLSHCSYAVIHIENFTMIRVEALTL